MQLYKILIKHGLQVVETASGFPSDAVMVPKRRRHEMHDQWFWSLVDTSEFSVKSVRNLVDDTLLHSDSSPTRWIMMIPIKVNVFVWRVQMDKLPTRLNLSLRGDVLCKVMTWGDLDSPTFFRMRSGCLGSLIFIFISKLRLFWKSILCDVVADIEISE
ncbi:hypothetical protein Tco_0495943 [Tanacetum coccineum]